MRASALTVWGTRLGFVTGTILSFSLLGCAGPPPLEVTLSLDESWSSGLLNTETHLIDLGSDGGLDFLGHGWYYNEIQRKTGDSFVWSQGPTSEIRFHLGWQRDLLIEICGRPFHWPGAMPQTIAVELNGNPIGTITELTPANTCSTVILPADAQIVGRNLLMASYGRVNSPSEVIEGSTDERDLAFAWSEVIFHGVDGTPMETMNGGVFMPAGAVADHFIELSRNSVLQIGSCESIGESSSVLSVSVLGEISENEFTRSHPCSGEPLTIALGDYEGLARVRISTRPERITEVPIGIRLFDPAILAPPAPHGEGYESRYDRTAESFDRRPNVIIYLVDALRADRLGAYGCERPLSPSLDAMAATGITFTDVTAQSSWTKAAVASIFTGFWPRAHGVNGPDDRLPDHLQTLPEFLSADGYQTAAVVANAYVGEPFGFARGFDSFEFIEHTRGRSDVIHGRLEEWFAARGDRPPPFFLYVHTIDPHAPYAPPEPFLGTFASTVADPSVGEVETVRGLVNGAVEPTQSLGEDLRHLYDAEIAANDASFGCLLDLLEEVGELENTLVIFTSDHGEAFGEHGHWTHGLDLYNEVLAVPLVMRLPGGVNPGLRVTAPVQHIDLLPTILGSCGIDAGKSLPGTPLLAGDGPAALDSDRPIFAYLDYWGKTGATVLRGGWKLIDPLSADFGSERELYRHDTDPAETHELSADSPVRRGWLASILAVSLTTRGKSVATEVDPEIKAQLEALGYMN